MTVAAGIAGFATTRLLGRQTTKQIQTTVDLKSQFEGHAKAISMQATVYSEDEFGGLASSFNEMARVFLGLLWRRNARPRAGASQEELQRQIRLLDDVEGAAAEIYSASRGQLMSWGSGRLNLTIQNLRKSCNK